MEAMSGTDIIEAWPEESREAAQLVIDKYGQPHEASQSQLIWHNIGPWKRMVATKAFYHHDFPVPHIDAVESVIDFEVPASKIAALFQYDGSVVVERTAGEVSARCHDEEANLLALNLMHDVVTGLKDADQARASYAEEFLNYRRKRPTPYMDKLHFTPAKKDTAGDRDRRLITDQELEQAVEEGKHVSAA